MNIKRQPSETENDHHGDQHSIGAARPFAFQFLFSGALGARLELGSDLQLGAHFRVAERDDHEWHYELDDRRTGAERSSAGVVWPGLLAELDHISLVLDLGEVHEDRVRQRQRAGRNPDDNYDRPAHFHRHSLLERKDDHEVSIHSDRH